MSFPELAGVDAVARAAAAAAAATAAATNTRTAGLVAATATVGSYLDLKEGTNNGTNRVRFVGPAALGADRDITIPDAAVNLGLIATSVQTVAGLSPTAGAIAVQALRSALAFPCPVLLDFPVSAAASTFAGWVAPWDCTVSAIYVWTLAASAPTAGTLAVLRGAAPGMTPSGGNTLLSAATYTLSGLTARTVATMTLTGTAADLNFDAGQGVIFDVTNLDGAGGIFVELVVVPRAP